MSNLISYNNTVDHKSNIKAFIALYGNKIFELHKQQDIEERINSYSKIQYEVSVYKMAYNYCLNLFFLSLETLKGETKDEATERVKEEYNFHSIQSNMAHKGIDLDAIYDIIVIHHTPVSYE